MGQQTCYTCILRSYSWYEDSQVSSAKAIEMLSFTLLTAKATKGI